MKYRSGEQHLPDQQDREVQHWEWDGKSLALAPGYLSKDSESFFETNGKLNAENCSEDLHQARDPGCAARA